MISGHECCLLASSIQRVVWAQRPVLGLRGTCSTHAILWLYITQMYVVQEEECTKLHDGALMVRQQDVCDGHTSLAGLP